MKAIAAILLLLVPVLLQAQQSIQTIVPLQPVAVGAAFQVQYIVTGTEPVVTLQSPAFGRAFRFVSGPRLYQGEAFINNKRTPIQNFSYTLIPLRKGRLAVKGATAVLASGALKSNDNFVLVTDPAPNDPLRATALSALPRLSQGTTGSTNWQKSIFIKTTVSKQTCFVGEPVVARFILFSRLPSASEIIKNPGFYGFSVSDLPDAADGGQTVQTHNGNFYNTHMLRQVQLYPAQSGRLMIDKMSVRNTIEYTDSASGAPVQTTLLLESTPAVVTVKPLPTPPHDYAGAVGHFTIEVYLDKKTWPQNRTGRLTVRINGSGNFLQLAAPDIQWPAGLNVLEPVVVERLQKEVVPVSGTRTYTYTLAADSAGAYVIPPIAFSFFDAAEKKYKTAVTDSLRVTVSKSNHIALPFHFSKSPAGAQGTIWLVAGALLTGGSLFLLWRFRRRKINPAPRAPQLPDAEARIRAIKAGDADAYRRLQQEVAGFLKAGAGPMVQRPADSHYSFVGLSSTQGGDLQAIIAECEAVQYYNAAPSVPFTELQQQAIALVRQATQRPPQR